MRWEASLARIAARVPELRTRWQESKPFRYLVCDAFLMPDFAEQILSEYPSPSSAVWNDTTYVHQRRKLTLTSGFPALIAEFFDLTSSDEFREVLTEITGIDALLHDPDLVGGGLHQVLPGGFLNVHVDYNFHPKTKLHRRLNLLLYMNEQWKEEYGGYLELWDMSERRQIESIAPTFNRAVLFETNEVSFHGHPRPIASPPAITRKSLAVYYYSVHRNVAEVAPEHNTLYRQTTGLAGLLKVLRSSLEATRERLRTAGPAKLGRAMVARMTRLLSGAPPPNN